MRCGLTSCHVSNINDWIVFVWSSLFYVARHKSLNTRTMAPNSLFTVCVCALAVGSIASASKIPSKWTTCPQSKPDFLECLGKSIQSAVKSMKNGERSLGIGPLDPLKVSSLHIGQGTGPVAIELDFNDLDFKGTSKVEITNTKYDPATNKLSCNIAVPEIVLDGKYKVNGKVLVLPIKGNGDCHLQLDQVTGTVQVDSSIHEENGKKYMHAEKFDFKFDPKNMKVNFENLFDGNKELGDNMNKFLNENYQVVLNELKPAIAEAFGLAFQQITNQVFSKIPVEEIFPQ